MSLNTALFSFEIHVLFEDNLVTDFHNFMKKKVPLFSRFNSREIRSRGTQIESIY